MNSGEEKAIIEAFVARWVIKTRRERALFELMHEDKRNQFVRRLNHNWETVLDMRYLERLGKGPDEPATILRIMGINSDQPCYAISTYGEFDKKVMGFKEAFCGIYGRGFASLLVTPAADAMYLETELYFGPQTRFAGRRRIT